MPDSSPLQLRQNILAAKAKAKAKAEIESVRQLFLGNEKERHLAPQMQKIADGAVVDYVDVQRVSGAAADQIDSNDDDEDELSY